MPWSKGSHPRCKPGQIAVIKDSDNSLAGCHDSEESADAQIRALYASEEATVETEQMTMNLNGPWGSVTFTPPNFTSTVPFEYDITTPTVIWPPGFGGTNPEMAVVTIDTNTTVDAPAEDGEPIKWEAVLAIEGVPTDDNGATPRIILPEAMSWRELPFPLLAMTEIVGEGHMGQKVVGHVDEIWREPMEDGAWAIKARGVFDTGEFGTEIARMVAERTLNGVSIDPGGVEWALVARDTLEPVAMGDLTPDELMDGAYYAAMTSGKILGATVCPMQAIEGATIEILVATASEVGIFSPHFYLVDEVLAACAAGPIAPPAEWFADPGFRRPTPITVTDEGRVFGHISTWDCHAGYEDRCMRAPRSTDGYARFHTGGLVTAEGQHIRVGRIQVKPHAPRKMSIDEVVAYYSDPKTVGAFGCLYEDAYGVAFAGVTKSDAPPELLRDFYANPPSGEWRRGELLGISCVPLPGLPVVAPEAYLVASGTGEGEVAILRLPGVTEEFCAECEADEVDVLVAAAALEGDDALLDIVAA